MLSALFGTFPALLFHIFLIALLAPILLGIPLAPGQILENKNHPLGPLFVGLGLLSGLSSILFIIIFILSHKMSPFIIGIPIHLILFILSLIL